MAVKIHNFFKRYKHDTLPILALVQVLNAVFAGTIAICLWTWLHTDPLLAFGVGVVTLILLNLLATNILFKIASKPLQVLSQAIAHVSKDPVITEPPDISAKNYESSGLKAMVQTVYELAVDKSDGQHSSGQEANGIFAQMADNMPCGLVALGKGGQIVYSNKNAPIRDNPDGGKDLELIFDQNDNFQTWLAACEANKVHDTHLWLRVADKLPGADDRRIFDVTGYYQKESPSGVEVILIAFDRTTAYAPDQEDMDFIALAAHELRGPITVIRGYLDVFQQELEKIMNPEQRELLDRLHVSTERLSGYVNNILNVSRYDRDQFKIHMHEESLPDVMSTLIPELNLRASTQHRSLTFQVPENLPSIAADRSSITEVISNLTDNAIKYSHENGQIVIAAAPKDDFVEITVQDSGIGMPAPVVGGLFNKFYRSHRSKQNVGGTGLGLFICKAIVELHGGTIWVRSVENQGSTFGFTIPTYASVADKLKTGDNQDITQRSEGWIKNHAMYRR